MSMIAYDQFMREVKGKCAEAVTASQLDVVMDAIGKILVGFELTQIQVDETGETDVLLETYLDALRVEGRSEITIYHYNGVIRRMLKHFSTNSINITTYHIRKYLSDEKTRGVSDETLRSIRSVFSSYFGWLIREGLITKNPIANIGPIKAPKRIRKAYTDVDIEKLKAHATEAKQKALICFLDATGCRVSEAVGLNRDSIDLDQMKCSVIGKGNKERTVYFDDIAAEALRQYLNRRTDSCPALFINRFNERIAPDGIRKMLKTIGKKAGLEKVHPHRFRRTRATKLIKRGMPIQEVASILGHEKLDTTMKYVVLDQRNVENSYHRYT